MTALDWRSVAITCSFAMFFVIVLWNVRKKESNKKGVKKIGTEEKSGSNAVARSPEVDKRSESESSASENSNDRAIPELPNPRWIKVGRIEELYMYPLKSGRGKDVTECDFTEYGISLSSPGRCTLRDRMFLVYNEETRRFQTGRKYPTLILVGLSALDETKVKLEAVGMPSVVFQVPRNSEAEAIECTMWWGEPVKCIDCGSDAAEWISRFLTGTNSGLRLAYATAARRSFTSGPWEKYTKVYDKLRNEDAGLFSDLSSYMLMNTQSLEELNEKLEKPVPIIQFRPNIVVSAKSAFEEDRWEWIKIGENAVIRNVKPCTRCAMIRVDPMTATADKEEPTKTLKTFRELDDPKRVALEGRAPTMGINCGLYVTGKVRIGDEVFVHRPDESMEVAYERMPNDDS